MDTVLPPGVVNGVLSPLFVLEALLRVLLVSGREMLLPGSLLAIAMWWLSRREGTTAAA